MPLASADLHVMVAATHAFDHSVAHTVVVDNVDPILKSERASLLVAAVLYGEDPAALVDAAQADRVAAAGLLLGKGA